MHRAADSAEPGADYFPHPFQLRGRIGRLRFMAYALLASLPWGLPAVAAGYDIINAFPQWLRLPVLLVTALLLMALAVMLCSLLLLAVGFVVLASLPAQRRASAYGPPPCASHALLLVPIALWLAYPAAFWHVLGSASMPIKT
ncbi:hypothetical protein F2P45_05205 [Massilia sp. CCM 8733]|uniref:Uncharacterized protein n=1 Tax=Massilia mucilaginosa TaxID=2609282 RepID=A0ABX0NNN2_9BURK|nr:hypothetical protein [Massilia mucilaginosa]NHZ88424.1 hypothetical protein [Massilia mucilaginosa]